MRIDRVEAREVELIPERIEEGLLYVSRRYATAIHKCCCGCGQEVVTPLSPRDWRVTPGHSGVRLYPSIGNWGLPCRSHYWIWDGSVVWDEQWSPERVAASQASELALKQAYYGRACSEKGVPKTGQSSDSGLLERLWSALAKWMNS